VQGLWRPAALERLREKVIRRGNLLFLVPLQPSSDPLIGRGCGGEVYDTFGASALVEAPAANPSFAVWASAVVELPRGLVSVDPHQSFVVKLEPMPAQKRAARIDAEPSIAPVTCDADGVLQSVRLDVNFDIRRGNLAFECEYWHC
jgi:hypothetical protein